MRPIGIASSHFMRPTGTIHATNFAEIVNDVRESILRLWGSHQFAVSKLLRTNPSHRRRLGLRAGCKMEAQNRAVLFVSAVCCLRPRPRRPGARARRRRSRRSATCSSTGSSSARGSPCDCSSLSIGDASCSAEHSSVRMAFAFFGPVREASLLRPRIGAAFALYFLFLTIHRVSAGSASVSGSVGGVRMYSRRLAALRQGGAFRGEHGVMGASARSRDGRDAAARARQTTEPAGRRFGGRPRHRGSAAAPDARRRSLAQRRIRYSQTFAGMKSSDGRHGAGESGQRSGGREVDQMADNAREASEFLKALAHESGLMILCNLLDGEKSVGELEACCRSGSRRYRSNSRAFGWRASSRRDGTASRPLQHRRRQGACRHRRPSRQACKAPAGTSATRPFASRRPPGHFGKAGWVSESSADRRRCRRASARPARRDRSSWCRGHRPRAW